MIKYQVGHSIIYIITYRSVQHERVFEYYSFICEHACMYEYVRMNTYNMYVYMCI